MAKEITVLKMRGNLEEVLEEVYYKGQDFIIKRGKKPIAVLISLNEFESYKRQRKEDMSVFDRIRSKAKAGATKDVEADTEEAVKARH
jgi:prevent-host-death family protein